MYEISFNFTKLHNKIIFIRTHVYLTGENRFYVVCYNKNNTFYNFKENFSLCDEYFYLNKFLLLTNPLSLILCDKVRILTEAFSEK